jgi:hypothetical protein
MTESAITISRARRVKAIGPPVQARAVVLDENPRTPIFASEPSLLTDSAIANPPVYWDKKKLFYFALPLKG